MNDLALSLRQARPSDAADLARIYIESWQDTYPGLLPHGLLGAMSLERHAARWRNTIRGGSVLVADVELAPGVQPTNLACAIAVAVILGVDTDVLADRVATLPSVDHRLAAVGSASTTG